MLRLCVLSLAAGFALSIDSATVTLSNAVVQAQPIPTNFAGFSIEVSGAIQQFTVAGSLRVSFSNLMVRMPSQFS